jgi:serine/threonine protein kinase
MSNEGGPRIGGRYRLGPALGSGGMGTVYLARDERLDRDVAVKLLRMADDEREFARFRREARSLAGLHHPNLVAAYDTGADAVQGGSVVWLVMEFVAGPDLSALLDRRDRLPSEDVRIVLRDVAAGLAALHAAGVLHRDLKPANVLLTAEPGSGPWTAKLADLGIAQLEQSESLTTTGRVLGTAAYLSPEQVAGDDLGPASDVYSLGLLALEALTGERAFPGSAAESAAARLVRPPAVPAWIDGGWRMLLESMTALDPRQRPTAGQVEAASAAPLPVLVPAGSPRSAAASADLPTVPSAMLPETAMLRTIAAPEPPRRPRRAGLVVALLTAGGLLTGAFAVAGAAGRPEQRPSGSPTPVAASSSSSPVPATTTAPRPAPTASTATVKPVAPAPAPAKGKGHGKGKKHGKGHG